MDATTDGASDAGSPGGHCLDTRVPDADGPWPVCTGTTPSIGTTTLGAP